MRNPNPPVSPPAERSEKKSATPCCSKVGLKRGPWTPEEDELLSKYIKREGEGKWRTLPKRAGLLRCGKSCRLRWMNYLRPSVKRGHIAADEEDLILRLHRLLGNRWSLIAGRIPGRTDNEIKNYWNTHLSKKLISQGIDPRTHKPLKMQQPQEKVPIYSKPSSSSRVHEKPPSDTNIMQEGNTSEANSGTVLDDATSGSTSNQIQPIKTPEITHKLPPGNNQEDEDTNNYYTDDVLYSFLNSLINEDAFAGQQQHSEMPIVPATDPLVASTYGIGFDLGSNSDRHKSASE